MNAGLICIGSVLWDMIGRTSGSMVMGADVPGRVERVPGGVALNIALGLAGWDLAPCLLSAIGRDMEGDTLLAEAARRGVRTDIVRRSAGAATDRYMVLEGGGRLFGAIADTRTLEKAGTAILAPLLDGRLGTAATPFAGIAVLDGNLPAAALAQMAAGPWLASADLRVAPASPGKVARLAPLLSVPRATIYLNRIEAELLSGGSHPDAASAARALAAGAAARLLVTDGAGEAALALGTDILTSAPPQVRPVRVTGAGDMLVAGHIAAELRGLDGPAALDAALAAAARHVAGEDAA